MDGNACLMELTDGIKVDYSTQIKAFCVGSGEGNTTSNPVYQTTIKFYELKPRQEEFVWMEAMKTNTVFRSDAISGKTRRDKLEETYQEIESKLNVRRTYG